MVYLLVKVVSQICVEIMFFRNISVGFELIGLFVSVHASVFPYCIILLV